MPTLYLIRGLPGSGKSTLAHLLCPGYAVAADDFMVDENGHYAFIPGNLPDAHAKCQEQVGIWMRQEMSCAVHNTFAEPWEAEPYKSLAKRHGYYVFVLECQNNFENVHGVPDSVILSMARKWAPLV